MVIEYLYELTHKYLFYSRLFSTSFAALLSFLIGMIFLQPYIKFLRKFNFSSELSKNSNDVRQPVMPAGIFFLFSIMFTVLITTRINSYVISALVIYVFFSVIGAIDDIAKIVNKRKLEKGLITKEDYQYKADGISSGLRLFLYLFIPFIVAIAAYKFIPNINGHIAVPFFSIAKKFPYMPAIIFIPLMALVIATTANGVNFTDGIDTLATIPLITSYIFVGIIAYVSSNRIWSSYLIIPYIPGVEEILPLIGAVIGTLLAFLWYNSPPSSIIMGDSGSVGLGGLMGILFIFIKAQFYLPIIGFIFLIEFLSSLFQIIWFKLTKKRIFLCAPIHHHFHLKMKKKGGYGSDIIIKSKIAWRFHIISVVLLILGTILFIKVH